MGGRIKDIGRALVVGWFVLIGTAEAGPPFVTDDPEVPPVGGWEINIPFTLNRTPGSTQMNAPLFDFNYGLPQLQLEFDVLSFLLCNLLAIRYLLRDKPGID
jgi:hypothetical protein